MPQSPVSQSVANSGSGFAPNGSIGGDPNSNNINQGGQGIFGWSNNGFSVTGPQGQIPTEYSSQEGPNGTYVPTYTLPSPNENFIYANPNAYADANAPAIYGAIAQGFNNAVSSAPTMQGAALGTGFSSADQSLANAQNTSLNQLYNQSMGNGPSVAVTQANQQRDSNIQAAMAMLGSQSGSASPALAARSAGMQMAQANQQAAQTGALGQSQEAINAINQLPGALSSARGQTQSMGLAQQQIGQQTNAANLSSQTSQNQLNATQYAQALQAYLQQNQTDISNNAAYQQMIANEQLGNEQIATGHQIGQEGQDTGLAAAGVSALASIAAAAA